MTISAPVREDDREPGEPAVVRRRDDATRRVAKALRRPGTLVAALLVLFSSVIVALHIDAFTVVSPVDELQHIDYLYRASDGGIVRLGDRVGESAMREQACRGHAFPVLMPPCDAPDLRPEQFQEEGVNTAYIHPPAYYTITGVTARVVRAALGHQGLFTAGRYVGAAWLGAAVVLMWLLMREFRVPIAARGVVLVIVITAPTVVLASATIGPDATALATGAAVLLATLLAERGRVHWLVPAVMAAIAIAFKATNIAGVGVCVLYLVARLLQARLQARASAPGHDTSVTSKRLFAVVAAVVGGALVASIGWIGIQGAIAREDREVNPQVQLYGVDSFPRDELRDDLLASVTPLKRSGYVSDALNTSRLDDLMAWVNTALLAGCVVAIGFSKPRSRMRALAIAAFIAMLLVGPGIIIVNYFASGIFVLIPARYGLSVVPALACVCTVPLQRRPILIAGAGLAGWISVVTLFTLT